MGGPGGDHGGRHHRPHQPQVEAVDDGGGEADRPFFLLVGTAVQFGTTGYPSAILKAIPKGFDWAARNPWCMGYNNDRLSVNFSILIGFLKGY